MAKYILNNAGLVVAGVDLSNHVQSVTIEQAADVVETTGMGATAKEHLLGIRDDSMTVTFFQDFAAGNVDATLYPLLGSNTGFTVVAYANGTTASSTSPKWTMVAILPKYNPMSGGVGDASTTEVVFQNQAAAGITRGTA